MMVKSFLIFSLSLLICAGCSVKNQTSKDTTVSRSPEMQKYIDDLLAEDAANKQLEREYLHEIAVAQEHNDHDAYKFYVVEFIKVPRLEIPEWMKKEPGYMEPISEEEIINRRIIIRVGPAN